MIPTRPERSSAAKRLSHSHSFCLAFAFPAVVNIKVEVDVWHVTSEGGLCPVSQTFRVASMKVTRT